MNLGEMAPAPKCPYCFSNSNVTCVVDSSQAEGPEDVYECSRCAKTFTERQVKG